MERLLPFLNNEAARDQIGPWRLETKNDESRFGLTRALLARRGSLERGQSHRLSLRRAKRNCQAP